MYKILDEKVKEGYMTAMKHVLESEAIQNLSAEDFEIFNKYITEKYYDEALSR